MFCVVVSVSWCCLLELYYYESNRNNPVTLISQFVLNEADNIVENYWYFFAAGSLAIFILIAHISHLECKGFCV
jgi:hypothetical protein